MEYLSKLKRTSPRYAGASCKLRPFEAKRFDSVLRECYQGSGCVGSGGSEEREVTSRDPIYPARQQLLAPSLVNSKKAWCIDHSAYHNPQATGWEWVTERLHEAHKQLPSKAMATINREPAWTMAIFEITRMQMVKRSGQIRSRERESGSYSCFGAHNLLFQLCTATHVANLPTTNHCY